MNVKRLMAATMAGVMAVSTAIVFQISAVAAEDVVLSGAFDPAGSQYADEWCKNAEGEKQYVHQSTYAVDDFSAISDVKINLNVTETNAHVTAVKYAIINSGWDWVDGTSGTIDVSSSGAKTATIDLTSLSEDLLATCSQVLFRVETDSIVEGEVTDFGFTVTSITGTSNDTREWEETTVWTGSSRQPEVTEFDFSKLSDEAVFTITLNTAADSEGYTKGWGIGKIVANGVWGSAIEISSPGPDLTDATVSFKLADLLSKSGESELNKLTVQLYKEDKTAAVTKITVKDVSEEPDTPAAPSYTGDEGITSAENITPGTTLVQKTAVVDGEYNARFVQKVSEDDIKDATKVVFTLSNGTDTKTVESHNYFNSLKVNGNKITVDDGYVFVSYTIKDIPAGIEVTCEGVTAEFIS